MNNMGFKYIVVMVNRGSLDDAIESMVFGIVRLQERVTTSSVFCTLYSSVKRGPTHQ